LSAQRDELMNFEAEGDDGYRVFINDSLMVDSWLRNRRVDKQFRLPVKKDSSYKIKVEFYQADGNASIRLKAGNYMRTNFSELANRVSDADAILFVGGISPQLEGEEMPVAVPGFKGGDRTSILLPAVQTELMKTLKATGKPVVFVMMTGSALATPWESENIPAIVNAWYGGQSAGTAVADVMFGDYNPAGRLPVTFYKSDADLPFFMEYDMTGRTYRYFGGEALYPFGYGLSYTTFNYSGIKAPAALAKNSKMTVSIMVKNSGKMDGEEVVQLYVSHQDVSGKAPLRALKGFQRIALKAGQSKLVTFTLTPEQLSLVSESDGKLFQPGGKITISVGGGQPGVTNKTTSNVIKKVVTIQ
jgi:beta-glucosidase